MGTFRCLLFSACWLGFVTNPAFAQASRLELQDQRFVVEVDWQDAQGQEHPGTVATLAGDEDVPLRTSDSTAIEFFGQSNWELLLKVLDARGVNGRFWVFLSAASDVGYSVRVHDTVCGITRTYAGELGTFQPSTTDTDAFADCSSPAPASCSTTDGVICLGNDRFEVTADWTDFRGNTGIGRQVLVSTGGLAQSDDSGLFTFFDPDNWEMLVKVLDGCDVNGHFWVFNAATTNLGFTLTVRDRETDARRRFINPAGTAAVPFGRTGIFPCEDVPPPPPPPDEVDGGSFRLNGAGYNNRRFEYTEDGGNLVFCRPQNQNLLWIRLARDTNNDGENSPHLDIDVCRYRGGGSFTPGSAPLLPSCSSGKEFDIFWHDGPGTFVNVAAAPACSLQFSQDGQVLAGTFQCSGMVEFQGTQSLDLSAGEFRCELE